ncbi:MAG: hypothetical protein LC799_06050 [Actinobacteria bacterium]|nr:hypothetical protein [Actinomycetota bacterium]
MQRRPWLIAFVVGIALTPVVEAVMWTLPPENRWLLDPPGLYCVLIVAAALAYLAGRRRAPAWALALALLSFAAFVVRAVSLWHYATTTDVTLRGSAPLTLGVVQTVAVLAVGLLLATLANRGLRRFPSLDPAASPTLDR